jgi:hypothetical protein
MHSLGKRIDVIIADACLVDVVSLRMECFVRSRQCLICDHTRTPRTSGEYQLCYNRDSVL